VTENRRPKNGLPPPVASRHLAASDVEHALAASAATRTRTDPDHSSTVEPGRRPVPTAGCRSPS
jgi:hypothetical protein